MFSLKFPLDGNIVQVLGKPYRLQTRTNHISLLLQKGFVTIVVARKVLIWVVTAIIAWVLFRKLISRDLYYKMLFPASAQNNFLPNL